MFKNDFRVWNKVVFGRVEVKMRGIVNEVGELERKKVGRELDKREMEKKAVQKWSQAFWLKRLVADKNIGHWVGGLGF